MTHAVFRARRELGGRSAERAIEEHGVVAEAAATPRRAGDLARPGSARDQRRGILGVLERDEHAVKACGSVERRRIERRRFEFVMMATVLAGFWSLMSGTFLIMTLRAVGLLA